MAEHVPNIGHAPAEGATRDAIHFAVMPIEAGNKLAPGARVGILNDGRAGEVAAGRTIGIADPFRREPIPLGGRFWLFLDPGTITGLRHEWTHPAFPRSGDEKVLADAFICRVAAAIGYGYDFLMKAADRFAESADSKWGCEYTHMGENEDYKRWDDWDGFWRAYEIVRGIKLKDTDLYAPFSCSC